MPLRLRPGGPYYPTSASSSSSAFSPAYQRRPEHHDRSPGYQPKTRVTERYRIIGFISSGTYGRVYKAVSKSSLTTNSSNNNNSGTSGKAGANATGSLGRSSSSLAVPTTASPGGTSSPGANPAGPAGKIAVVSEVAIKKFKPDKEGEQISYTGISQSAIREMSLCSELHHPNVIRLVEIMLEDRCIFMVFEYAEHDLLQIIHHHTQQPRHPIPPATVKSIMFQLLNGCQYLHTNWVLHRDLKPANIMVTSGGEVKIGDLGLARRFDKPLHSLFSGDKVVVTIWYRAPELILGSFHYTPAMDMWAIGCIFAELLSLRPIFKGEEAKMDSKKTVPFQRNQMQKIVDIMGLPTKERWPLLTSMPEYNQLRTLQAPLPSHHSSSHNHSSSANSSHYAPHHHHQSSYHHASSNPYSSSAASSSSNAKPSHASSGNLEKWYYTTINQTTPISSTTTTNNTSSSANSASAPHAPLASLGAEGYKLLAGLLEYDPQKRLTAAQALQSPFFTTGPDRVSTNAFEGLKVDYPHRRVSQDDNDIRTSSLPGTKRSGLPDDSLLRPSKRIKE